MADIVNFTPPLNENRGRWFKDLLAFGETDSDEVHANYISPNGCPVRNSLAFWAFVHTLIEGMLERWCVPCCRDTGAKFYSPDDFGVLDIATAGSSASAETIPNYGMGRVATTTLPDVLCDGARRQATALMANDTTRRYEGYLRWREAINFLIYWPNYTTGDATVALRSNYDNRAINFLGLFLPALTDGTQFADSGSGLINETGWVYANLSIEQTHSSFNEAFHGKKSILVSKIAEQAETMSTMNSAIDTSEFQRPMYLTRLNYMFAPEVWSATKKLAEMIDDGVMNVARLNCDITRLVFSRLAGLAWSYVEAEASYKINHTTTTRTKHYRVSFDAHSWRTDGDTDESFIASGTFAETSDVTEDEQSVRELTYERSVGGTDVASSTTELGSVTFQYGSAYRSYTTDELTQAGATFIGADAILTASLSSCPLTGFNYDDADCWDYVGATTSDGEDFDILAPVEFDLSATRTMPDELTARYPTSLTSFGSAAGYPSVGLRNYVGYRYLISPTFRDNKASFFAQEIDDSSGLFYWSAQNENTDGDAWRTWRLRTSGADKWTSDNHADLMQSCVNADVGEFEEWSGGFGGWTTPNPFKFWRDASRPFVRLRPPFVRQGGGLAKSVVEFCSDVVRRFDSVRYVIHTTDNRNWNVVEFALVRADGSEYVCALQNNRATITVGTGSTLTSGEEIYFVSPSVEVLRFDEHYKIARSPSHFLGVKWNWKSFPCDIA